MAVYSSVVFAFVAALFVGISYATIDVYDIVEIDETLRSFTDEEIAEYSGKNDDLPTYLAVLGVVFDVTSEPDFYGKNGGYNFLAGKDASRSIAKWSTNEVDFNSNLDGLEDDTLQGLLDNFTGTYMAKYPVMGYMEYLLEMKRKTVHDDL